MTEEQDSTANLTEGKKLQLPKLTYQHDLIELRRARVLELLAKGWTQTQIAKSMSLDKSTISLDVKQMREDALKQQETITDRLFEEQRKALTGLDLTLYELWTIVERSNDAGERMQALSLIAKVYQQRLEVTAGKFFKDITAVKQSDLAVIDNVPEQQFATEEVEEEEKWWLSKDAN